jgi:hypothetical protein
MTEAHTAPVEPAAAPEPAAPETTTIGVAELAALRRSAAESAKAARAAKEAAQGAQRDRDAVTAENARILRDQRVIATAYRLNFHNPTDVLSRVTAAEAETDSGTETALARIAKASPYLVATPETAPPVIGQVLAPGAVDAANASNGGPNAVYTPEQVRAMKASDFARMSESQFAAVRRVLATINH